MRTNQGDELQLNLHLSRTESTTQGGPGRTVCELRVSWMRVERLIYDIWWRFLQRLISEGL
jgi:hypothetical protein